MIQGQRNNTTTGSGTLDQTGAEASGADVLGCGNAVNDDFDLADVRLLPGQRAAGNLGTGYADFPAEKYAFLTDITLRHLNTSLRFK